MGQVFGKSARRLVTTLLNLLEIALCLWREERTEGDVSVYHSSPGKSRGARIQISVKTLRLLTPVVFVPHNNLPPTTFPRRPHPQRLCFPHGVKQASIGRPHLRSLSKEPRESIAWGGGGIQHPPTLGSKSLGKESDKNHFSTKDGKSGLLFSILRVPGLERWLRC